MVIFLYGLDSYRSKKKLEEIVDHYKSSGKSGLNLAYFDAQQADFEKFYDFLKTSSMFEEKKLVILKNIFSDASFQENFLNKIKMLRELTDVVVLYESSEVDQRLKIFKVLTKDCQSQEFKLLNSGELKDWIRKEFNQLNQKINGNALDLLSYYIGNDLWRLSNEIKKLADFKKDAVIIKENIEMLVKPKIEVDIFKTIDALAVKNKRAAFHFFKKHLDAGDNPLYLLSMVAYQFRNLLMVKELAQKGLMYEGIVKKSGLHPFVVKKNYFASRQFSLEELKNIYRRIFQIDTEIKRGKIEAETALDLLVSSI